MSKFSDGDVLYCVDNSPKYSLTAAPLTIGKIYKAIGDSYPNTSASYSGLSNIELVRIMGDDLTVVGYVCDRFSISPSSLSSNAPATGFIPPVWHTAPSLQQTALDDEELTKNTSSVKKDIDYLQIAQDICGNI